MKLQDKTDLQAGRMIDQARFAEIRWWVGTERRDLHTYPIQRESDGVLRPVRDPQSGEWHLGLEWSEPRDICQVVVEYADSQGVPPDVRVQYWQQNWPPPAPERWPGARRGWIGRDDPWHGHWTTARGEVVVDGNTYTITFDPVDLPELGGRSAAMRLNELEHYLARFRRTLKLRLVSGGQEQPALVAIRAYAPTTWQEGEVEVYFGLNQNEGTNWSGRAQVNNGHLLGIAPLDFGDEDALQEDGSWHCRVDGQPKGIRLQVLFAKGDPASADGTVVTVYTQARSFSFLVADLSEMPSGVEGGPIYIKDYGVLIKWAGKSSRGAGEQGSRGESSFSPLHPCTPAPLHRSPRPIYERVSEEPEQSLARATAEIPPLDVTKQAPFGRYLVLSLESGRQEFALRYNGELFADKSQLKLMGRDAAGLLWPGHQLRFRFGSGDPPDFRERRDGTRQRVLDGWLPVVISEWLDREIEYQQTAFVAQLDGPMTGPEERRGDEDIVAMLRFVVRNTTHGQKRARLWLVIAPQEEVEVRDRLVLGLGRVVPAEPVTRQWRVASYDAPCLRSAINIGGRGRLMAVPYAEEAGASQAIPTAVIYEVELAGGEAHSITLAMPFVSLTGAQEWEKVVALDYEAKLAEVTDYWRSYVEGGGQIETPDQVFSDFHKAVRVHVGINVDKDPATGMVIVPAGTWAYGACGNEACWQITMLDQAGHHDRAEAYLETFLRTQGVLELDGNFASKDGVLQAMDLDDGQPVRGGFSYNTDHGYIMECLANHYRFTQDRAWLERVTPHLIAACNFVIRERERTKAHDTAGQPVPEWGLLPAGHLEDNPEWRYWFAVNAHAYSGLKAIAEVLAEIEHPEAERLAREAEAYRADIRAAAQQAMVEAPVVQLLDGTYIPHMPTRTGLRGREWGWFREAAYGALHLLEGHVFEPDEEEMTWVLKDLEDNLFVSRDWGRPVDLERYWFSHGGVTIQPSLTDLAIDYLRRGQIKHALRALFNHFAASIYADVNVFTEHPVIELGHGVGPFYKASDEAKWLVWLRSFLLREEGDSLHLAAGVPRAWLAPGRTFGVRDLASFFGPLTYRVQSGSAETTVEVEAPDRRPPQALIVHLRRPVPRTPPPLHPPQWGGKRGGERASPKNLMIQTVTVNGKTHTDFDAEAEIVRIMAPVGKLVIRVDY